MKFSFGCLSTVLGSAVAMANENEKQVAPISTVVSGNKSRRSKKNIHSAPSPFSMVKGTDIYKQLSHQADVRDDTNRMKNEKSVAADDSDADVDVDMKVNKKEAAGTTVAVSAVATTTTTAAVSVEEVCVPPVTVTKSDKLDAGNLPLSSCSLKKQICVINSNNKKESTSSSSSIEKTGVCLDPWALPPSYSDNNNDPNNRDISSTSYEEDSYYTGFAATPSIHKEDDSFYKEYHAGSYDARGITGDYYSDDINHSDFYDNHMPYEQDYGDRPYATDRHLQGKQSCDKKCSNVRPPVELETIPSSIDPFRYAIKYCLDNDPACPSALVGIDLNCWNVSEITNMNNAFNGQEYFNTPLKCWDVGRVNTMYNMFRNATSFNQKIGDWDVGQVTVMRNMFLDASVFNQPLDSWNVSEVNYMRSMFNKAYSFNQPLDGWDVSQVTNMQFMFQSNPSFNQPLDAWDVSQVIDMYFMFRDTSSFNQPLDAWDVGSATRMYAMFYEATEFNQPLDSWNVSQVASMAYMFGLSDFNQPLDSWNVSQVGSMNGMFFDAFSFDQPLDSWNVGQVGNMMGMFYRSPSFNQPLDAWDVGSVTNMSIMFFGSRKFNQPLDSWSVSQVANMAYMFGFSNFNQPLDSWNVSQVGSVFYAPYYGDKVGSMNGMFQGAFNFDQPLDSWNVGKVGSMIGMFDRAYFFNHPLDSWSVGQVAYMEYMFYGAFSFNQCLSTWANKTDDVNTTLMLRGTSCYNRTPNADGPWCQTAEQCAASPTDPVRCEDDKEIKFIVGKKKKEKKCKKLKVSQCDKKYKTKSGSEERPKDFCFKLCDPNCFDPVDPCVEDKKKKYKFKVDGKTKKLTCQKIKEKKLCGTNLKNKDTLGKDVCPKTCKVKNCK